MTKRYEWCYCLPHPRAGTTTLKPLRTALSLLTLLALTACGDGGGPALTTLPAGAATTAAAPPAPVRPRIALVIKTLTNPFFVEMEIGARRAENELGVDLQIKTGAEETSVEQQIQIIDDFVAEHVDAIVIAPGDSRRLIPALKRAADQGIKLVNIDNALDADAARQAGLAPPPLVSVDNESAAYASARRIAAGAPPGTQAAIIEGIRSADNAQARKRGALRAFAENPGIRVVASHSAEWKIDEGYKVAGRILRDHPRVTRLFAANDMMALGAIKYLREAGRRDVKVAAYDALAEAVAEVRAGRLTATIDQQAAEQGYQGIVIAWRLLKGESIAPLTQVDTRLLTINGFQ